MQRDFPVGEVATGGGVVATYTNMALFIRRTTEFERVEPSANAIAVGPDGVVVAGRSNSLTFYAAGADPQIVPVEGVDLPLSLSRDGRGRTWVVGASGIAVVAPDGSVLRQWPQGRVPGIAGTITRVLVTGQGPELPD
jgi:hypothetical protein